VQTELAEWIRDTPAGREAEGILRKCVHCGFCTATCPTYQLLGDELDGPRGRIYLIKQALEGRPVTARTQLHLDRCLTCRACETTCPSGVRYGRLAEIGREAVDARVPRPLGERALRRALRAIIAYRARFAPLIGIGRTLRPLLPARLRRKVPPAHAAGVWPEPRHARRMLLLEGCVEPAIAPAIRFAAARVLDRLGIALLRAPRSGCCGALSHHLTAPEEAKGFMRRNIDAWWSELEAGAEAVVVTSSACAAMVKDYGALLADDPGYAEKASRVAALTRDLSEVIAAERGSAPRAPAGAPRRVAFHSPCTLQHGQRLAGVVEGILERAGFELTAVPEAHLCCGSAGTYSILQRALSERLLARKLEGLLSGQPELIATANIGCYVHLASGSPVPVAHWVELLDDHAAARCRAAGRSRRRSASGGC